MDQVITIAIILLLLAIIIGSLKRGIQSVISFALLGLLVTLLFARLPGRGMSFAFGLFGGGDNPDEQPMTAIKAFDQFSQASSIPNLSGSAPGGNTGTAPTSPSATSPGTTSPGGTSTTGTPGTNNPGATGNDGSGFDGTTSENGTNEFGSGESGSTESGDSDSTGVRAWW